MNKDNTVHVHDVTIARDLGTAVEPRDGSNGGDRVALSPPVDLVDNERVKVQAPSDNKSDRADRHPPQPDKFKAGSWRPPAAGVLSRAAGKGAPLYSAAKMVRLARPVPAETSLGQGQSDSRGTVEASASP